MYQMGPKLADGVAGLLAKALGHTEYPGSDTRSLSQPLLNGAYLDLILKRFPDLDARLEKIQIGDDGRRGMGVEIPDGGEFDLRKIVVTGEEHQVWALITIVEDLPGALLFHSGRSYYPLHLPPTLGIHARSRPRGSCLRGHSRS